MTFETVDTPAVLVDLSIVERNIRRYQAYIDSHGLTLRPHIKTHKLPRLARLQVASGAKGINCQKIGEAEVMADAGLSDILITYNILGDDKLARLQALHGRVTLSVTADNELTVRGLAGAFTDARRPLPVLVECDTGAARCGVQSPEAALALAQMIDQAPGLKFGGLMTYPAVGGAADVERFMSETKALLEQSGLTVAMITSGGTPDMMGAHDAPVIDEYRVGTYIYNDRSLIVGGRCSADDCALTVLSTVVSTPTPDRAIIDAGSKALTSDLVGLNGYGLILDHPQVRITGLSEEHGHVDCSDTPGCFQVGQKIRIIPNHACPVSNLVDAVILTDGQEVIAHEPVLARGKIS